MFRESPTHDKLLFPLATHKVMYDRLQIVVQHPSTCPNRGNRKEDHYKTFHRWPSALNRLAECGEALTSSQAEDVQRVGKQVDRAPR